MVVVAAVVGGDGGAVTEVCETTRYSLAFRLARYDRGRASDLVKKLYGQRTSSHGGTYVHRRKGLFDEIPHVRLIRGANIVRKEHARHVTIFLGALEEEVRARRVMLTKEDRQSLGE